jgi:hypothetical protein
MVNVILSVCSKRLVCAFDLAFYPHPQTHNASVCTVRQKQKQISKCFREISSQCENMAESMKVKSLWLKLGMLSAIQINDGVYPENKIGAKIIVSSLRF